MNARPGKSQLTEAIEDVVILVLSSKGTRNVCCSAHFEESPRRSPSMDVVIVAIQTASISSLFAVFFRLDIKNRGAFTTA